MATEKICLNMGIRIGEDNDAWESVVNKDFYMPDDHRYLFDFMKADLEAIIHMISYAIGELSPASLVQADEYLEKIHPFFAGEGNKDRREAYIYGTVALLVWSKEMPPEDVFDALGIENEWYRDKHHWLSTGSERGTLMSLSDCQLRTKRKVVLLLDDSNPEFSKLPMPVRAGLFGLVDGDQYDMPAIANATAKYVLPASSSIRTLGAVMSFDEDTAETFYRSIDEFVETGTIPENLKKVLKTTESDRIEDGFTEYDTEYLEQVIDLEIFFMLRDGVRLHKCAECGRYFPAEAEHTLCNIPDSDGSSCRSRAAKIEMEQLVKKIYTTAYKTHYARIQAGKETKDYVDRWRAYATALQEQVYKRQITTEEYKNKLME